MPFERIGTLLTEMAEMGTEEVWLAGRGEPLVHPQAREILELAGSLGMGSMITTNGGRLTEGLADRMGDLGVRQLSISIDSGSPETYARVHHAPAEDRERILRLMTRLSGQGEERPRLLVSMVISKLNSRELLRLVQDAIGAGASGIVVGGMRPVPFDSGDLAMDEGEWEQVREDLARAQEIAREARVELYTDNIRPARAEAERVWPYREMACFIGHTFTVVDVHGLVHGCCTCQNRLGSLAEASFRQIWWSRPYRVFRQVLREMPTIGLSPPQCECRYGCGHVAENAAIQRELQLRFERQARESGFATRADVAEALCRYLDAQLPSLKAGFEFADVSDERLASSVSRLRQVGIMAGIGSMHGVSLFEPQRMVAIGEFEALLRRALVASGMKEEKAEALIGASRAGSADAAEPLAKRNMEGWLEGVVGELERN
jgi:MoaA/NifB/PqqE/SkfB family radical SAM enzyme